MSHSDTESDGFESADDNEFDGKPSVKTPVKTKAPAKHPDPEPKSSKQSETLDKFKALDVSKDDDDDIDDSWGWGDGDDDEFDFKSPPVASSSVPVSKTSAQPTIEEQKPKTNVEKEKPLPEPKAPSTSSVIESKQATENNANRIENQSSARSSWTPWSGVVSLLSTASDGVASFTSHVSSVIESNIGVPDPAEIVQQQRAEKQSKLLETPSPESGDDARTDEDGKEEKIMSLGSLVSNVTQISNRVISGGLDTLEGIGKKTMTILQENDPGLINKRKLLGLDNDKVVLSQILREAKEKSEESERNMKLAQRKQYKKQLHFETLFDDYHGLVHLEALEMLSKQATIRLQSLLMPLTGLALSELQQTMSSVTELCELNELDQDETPDGMYDVSELEAKFKTATEDFDIPIDFTDILATWKVEADYLNGTTDGEEVLGLQDVHDKALKCLAKTSALAVNKYHKLAELLLIKEHHSTVNEAECLIQLTNTVCWHLSGIATNFSAKITNMPSEDPDVQPNTLITNIFLESSKSTSYIQNAFQLFIPILQIGAV